jgi:hypothetical protein
MDSAVLSQVLDGRSFDGRRDDQLQLLQRHALDERR